MTVAVALLLLAAPATAQEEEVFGGDFGVRDFCSDEDHSGPPYPDPNGGDPAETPSVIPLAASFRNLPPPDVLSEPAVLIEVRTPDGRTLTYEGPFLPDKATFEAIVGIDQGGEYEIVRFAIRGFIDSGPVTTEIDPGTLPNDGVMAVTFDAPQECDASTIRPGAFATLAEPEASESPEEAPEETPSPSPTEELISVGDEPGESTFREIFYIPIVIGGLLLVVGIVVYTRTRERGAPIPIGSKPPEPHGKCDWAAYYDDGTTRHVLREADGHECCVYVVRVTSKLLDFEYASRGRQATDLLDGVDEVPEGRLRIFDRDVDFTALDIHSWVSARSGPAGRLDWMPENQTS